MPARFVIGPDEVIGYGAFNPDHTRRREPKDVPPAIRGGVTTAY